MTEPGENTVSMHSKIANPQTVVRMEQRLPQMLEELAALTDIESPSKSYDALGACSRYVESLGRSLLGRSPRRVEHDGPASLLWQFGDTPRIVLVGHYDTVHPLGTVNRFPFSIDGEIVRGPGVCDMKGGVVIAFHALRDLLENLGEDALDGVCLFLNGDEELGSPKSNDLIYELADTAKFAIGFENAGSEWQIKTERRGCSHYELVVKGRAAHAGDGSEKGINALLELCAHAAPIHALADAELGTTVTPTLASSGTTTNSVPERASMWFDVRARSAAEQQRVDAAMNSVVPLITQAQVEVRGGIEQPPLPEDASAHLFAVAADVAKAIELPELTSMSVGGSADVCKFAGAGVQSIDGFGAVGGDDHSDREWIYLNSLPRQAALAAGLVERLLSEKTHPSSPLRNDFPGLLRRP